MSGYIGSNCLRGGIRTYEYKTLVGNYVEEAYAPNARSKALVSCTGGLMYETTTQAQMNDVSSREHLKLTAHKNKGIHVHNKLLENEFGAGLRTANDATPQYDYSKSITTDTRDTPKLWLSLTKSAHSNTQTPTEFAAPRELHLANGKSLQPMSPSQLQNHRDRWTNESVDVQRLRYQTEGTVQSAFLPKEYSKQLVSPTMVTFR